MFATQEWTRLQAIPLFNVSQINCQQMFSYHPVGTASNPLFLGLWLCKKSFSFET